MNVKNDRHSSSEINPRRYTTSSRPGFRKSNYFRIPAALSFFALSKLLALKMDWVSSLYFSIHSVSVGPFDSLLLVQPRVRGA